MQPKQQLSNKQYEKLSDWAERFTLAIFATLVLQRLLVGMPLFHPSVFLGAATTAIMYYAAYLLLKKS